MKENLQKLIELIQQNPDLRVVPMVDYEICAGDEYGYWQGSFGECVVTEIYNDDEEIHFEEDFDDLVDTYIDNNFHVEPILDEEELLKQAKEAVKNYAWEKVIVVYIELP